MEENKKDFGVEEVLLQKNNVNIIAQIGFWRNSLCSKKKKNPLELKRGSATPARFGLKESETFHMYIGYFL